MQVSFPNTKPKSTLCTPYLGVIPGVLDHEEAGHRHVLLVNIEQLGQPRVGDFFLNFKQRNYKEEAQIGISNSLLSIILTILKLTFRYISIKMYNTNTFSSFLSLS